MADERKTEINPQNGLQSPEKTELQSMLEYLQADERFRSMKNYIQHGRVSTYDHCLNVARLSDRIDRILAAHADRHVMLTGALLHDYYLYDWHDRSDPHPLHGYTHAETACRNAKKYLNVSDEVVSVIYSHMWPLNLTRVPRSREAWIVCMADKLAALYETVCRR